jgi:hypothetical protein
MKIFGAGVVAPRRPKALASGSLAHTLKGRVPRLLGKLLRVRGDGVAEGKEGSGLTWAPQGRERRGEAVFTGTEPFDPGVKVAEARG